MALYILNGGILLSIKSALILLTLKKVDLLFLLYYLGHIFLILLHTYFDKHLYYIIAQCPVNFAIFRTSGSFKVPCGVHTVKVLVVGGGAGGGAGTGGGGGSGVVRSSVFSVDAGRTIPITVGLGGGPATAGNASSFWRYLKAGSGEPGVGMFGGNGGASGGSGCSGFCQSEGGHKIEQSNYANKFEYNILTAGNGGAGV